jgi:hypothetical protein
MQNSVRLAQNQQTLAVVKMSLILMCQLRTQNSELRTE